MYTVVQLEEKIVAGVGERTYNADPQLYEVLQHVWGRFSNEVTDAVHGTRVNDNISYGLYNQYEADQDGHYVVTACCELIPGSGNPEGLELHEIRAGNYAKFVVGQDMSKISQIWAEVWATELDRLFTSDFEEYIHDAGGTLKEINIYVAIA